MLEGLTAEEVCKRLEESLKKVNMREVWARHYESVAPMIEANRQTRIESMHPKNAIYLD